MSFLKNKLFWDVIMFLVQLYALITLAMLFPAMIIALIDVFGG